ncbi:MAG TPA: hypothetical protein VFY93_17410 [Planctomycetota bacterium]|nr:hypothetical protein [Planctomycetota bacterium]
MKIVPVLAVTNALALALAIYLLVQQGDLKAQTGSGRSDSGEVSRLKARIDALERDQERSLAMRGIEPAAADDARHAAVPTGATAEGARSGGGTETPAVGGPAGDAEGEAAPDAGGEEFDAGEMDVFRKKVRKALELNSEEDQKSRILDGIDELVKQNKIAPLNARQKDAVASTVLSYRKKIPDVFRKLRENGAMEGATREDRGRIYREEFDALRAEAQRSLEEFMPAADAKTYLDETMREQMRGGFGGFGGGPPVQVPSPPRPSR